MSSWWEAQQQEGPPDEMDYALDWAATVGGMEGRYGPPMSDEGKAALTDETPLVRATFIRNYWEAFMIRQVDDGRITEAEYHFYDPYPGRWGAYWMDPHE